MIAVLFDKIGEPSEALKLRDLPNPLPGPGEAVVRVRLTPVHPSDLHRIRGRYGYQPELPASPGAEGVGVIESLGPGVKGPAVGTRVICIDCWGLWRELVVCSAVRLVAVPDGVSDEMAALAIITPITPWTLAVEEHKLKAGEWLLQTAAGSSVGKPILQLAKLLGFKTINVIRRRAQEDEIRALSGDVVIYTEDEELGSRIAEVTQGKGVTKSIDCVAGAVGGEIVRHLGPGGTMLQYGALSTHRQTDPQKLVMPVYSPKLIYAAATVRGWWLPLWIRAQPMERARSAMEHILALAGAGQISIPKAARFPLTRIADALHATEQAGRGSKSLLDFSV